MASLTMPVESLWTVAEFSLVIIGFSGIVAVMGRRATDGWTSEDLSRMAIMLISGFRTMFASIFPIVLINFEVAEKTVWPLSSGIIGTLYLILTIVLLRVARNVARDKKHSSYFQNIVVTLSFVAISINLLNAAGIVFHQSFGAYFLTVIIGFAVTCAYFVRLIQTELLSEIWEKAGHEQ